MLSHCFCYETLTIHVDKSDVDIGTQTDELDARIVDTGTQTDELDARIVDTGTQTDDLVEVALILHFLRIKNIPFVRVY